MQSDSIALDWRFQALHRYYEIQIQDLQDFHTPVFEVLRESYAEAEAVMRAGEDRIP